MASTSVAKFFKRLLSVWIGFRVLGTHRKSPKAECDQLFAHCPFVHQYAEPILDFTLEIPATPPNDAMLFRIWALAYEIRQFSLLLRVQKRGAAFGQAVVETIKALFIVTMDPVSKRLTVHAACLRRRLAVRSLQNKSDRQHAAGSIPIRGP